MTLYVNSNPDPEDDKPETVWFDLSIGPAHPNSRCILVFNGHKKSFEEQMKDMCDLMFGDTNPIFE